MKFNLDNKQELDNAKQYLSDLVVRKSVVEIKRVNPKRSLNQNNYLHVLIGAFGAHFGYTMEEAKIVYKQMSPEIYRYEKKSKVFWRSSADLNVQEMAKSIDRLRQISANSGYPLPAATDEGWLRAIENEIERSQHYL